MGMNLSGRALPQDRFLVGTKSHDTVNSVSIPAGFGFDQHVAPAEQVFGTKFIEDDRRLGPALDGQRNTRRDVAADEARKGLSIGTLGRQNQMNTCRARFLR